MRFNGPIGMVLAAAVVMGGALTTTACGGGAVKAAICGNGELESGELCDDGREGSGACTATCSWQEFNPVGSVARSNRNPAVAMNGAGQFVMAWQSTPDGGGDIDIYAAFFDGNGAVIAPAFQVNSTTAADQVNPSVALTDDGRFVVAWHGVFEGGINTVIDNVYLRAFGPDGLPVSGEIQLNDFDAGPQLGANVAVNQQGELVVAWASEDQDGSLTGVFAKRGSIDGSLPGPAFQVNTYTDDTQENPWVGVAPSGDFVVAWESTGQEST